MLQGGGGGGGIEMLINEVKKKPDFLNFSNQSLVYVLVSEYE